jgi:hypothetical protein
LELAKALLKELNDDLSDEKPESSGGKVVKVQFNPETLKVTFANQIQTPTTSGDQAQGSAGRQYVGAGTTKLALLLWFDVSAATDDEHRVDDVRRLTQAVLYFMTPRQVEGDPTKFVPPGVRFHWGTFKFDGIVDSMEETLEFFSSDGRPLRASISVNLSQQKILKAEFSGDGRVPGTRPLASAPVGAPLQSLMGAGPNTDVRAIATANNLDSLRRLEPGQLINLNLPGSGR